AHILEFQRPAGGHFGIAAGAVGHAAAITHKAGFEPCDAAADLTGDGRRARVIPAEVSCGGHLAFPYQLMRAASLFSVSSPGVTVRADHTGMVALTVFIRSRLPAAQPPPQPSFF